jgi:regulator of RNase E activity RraA
MKLPNDDAKRLEICRCELNSAVVGDVLDSLGFTRQFLPPEIQPLRDDLVVCGRAMTVLDADDDGGERTGRLNEALRQPFGLMLRALDELQPNDVYIASGGSPRYALWGELMSQAAINRGAVGAVLNGYSRDTPGVLALEFATFSRGRYAQDQRPRGKVVDVRCRIRFGDVMITPGDLVFGDLDGVCVIPREIEQDAIAQALEKARAEKTVMQAIKRGMGAQEAWDTYGVF